MLRYMTRPDGTTEVRDDDHLITVLPEAQALDLRVAILADRRTTIRHTLDTQVRVLAPEGVVTCS